MENSKKRFIKNIVGFSLMTWITFVFGFIASPIATRTFEPGELGRINMFTTYASLFGPLCYLGLDQAFARFYHEPPAGLSTGRMLSFCVRTSLVFGLLVVVGCIPWWEDISRLIIGEGDWTIFVCLAVYCFTTVVYRYLSLCYRMEQDARSYTIQGVIYSLLTKLGYVTVGLVVARARPAIWLMTGLTMVFAICCIIIQRRRFGHPVALNRRFVGEMSRYALPLMPMGIISWFNSSLSQVALQNLLGFAAVGIYTPAVSLANTVNLVQTGFNTYWCPYVYQNYKSDRQHTFFTVHRLMACALTFFGLGMTLIQTAVFLLLGAKYRSSITFFPFLFLSPICYCLSETTCMGIDLSKKTYWNTLIFIVTSAVNLLLCYLLIPLYSAAGAALASAGSAILMLTMRTAVGNHYYRAIKSYRYLIQSVALLCASAVTSLLLTKTIKYVILLAILAVAMLLFRKELKLIWDTGLELLRIQKRRHAAKGQDAAQPPHEEDKP